MRLYHVLYNDSDGEVTEGWFRNRRDATASAREEAKSTLGVGGTVEVVECYTHNVPTGELVLRALNRDDFLDTQELIAKFTTEACGKCDGCADSTGCTNRRVVKA